MSTLQRYKDTIETTGSLFQQVQTINPDYTLLASSLYPIRVSPQEWYIIWTSQPDLAWDPAIFAHLPVYRLTKIISYYLQ